MKKTIAVIMSVGLMAGVAKADVIFIEDFEDATVGYTTSQAEFSDGAGDYFIRTDGSDISSTYSGQNGSFYFAAMDLDAANATGSGGPTTVTLTFSGISISDYESLMFYGLFAEDDDGATNQDWDVNDGFLAEYQIDGGGFLNLIAFEDQGATNTEPLQDTDFDGVGDGLALTSTFTQFTSSIAGTGDSLDIRFTMSFDSGDEDIAFDDIRVEGTTVVPEPATMSMLLLGLVGARGLVHRRKRA